MVGGHCRGLVIGDAQEVAEDEELVLEDWAADRSAGVVVDEASVGAGGEVVAGVDAVVFHVLEDGAMKLVGAGLESDIDHGADGAAELGLEVVGRDVDVLDGGGGWHQDDVDAGALVVVDALNLVEVDVGGLTVGVHRKIVVGVVELRVVEDHRRHAGYGVEQGLEAVAAAERQIGRSGAARCVVEMSARSVCSSGGAVVTVTVSETLPGTRSTSTRVVVLMRRAMF